jgi:hypothetical protein
VLIALAVSVGCIIISAESKCPDMIRMLSSKCGVNSKGGVCCEPWTGRCRTSPTIHIILFMKHQTFRYLLLYSDTRVIYFIEKNHTHLAAHCKTYSGVYCEFPFIYKGKTYNKCTTDGNALGRWWCATKVEMYHRHCKEGCGTYTNDWSYCKPGQGWICQE